MIIDKIKCAQAGNQEAMLDLINKFMPLLKKYCYKLGYEDSLEDLQLEFITLIFTFKTDNLRDKSDGAVVSFIVRSVYNAYIKLLKSLLHGRVNCINLEDMTGYQQYMLAQDITEGTEGIRFKELLDLSNKLTSKEKYVLEMVFYKGYSSTQVAKELSTTRQNINQIKRKGLVKLREALNIMGG